MKTELLALIDELVKSERYVTKGKFSAAKDAKRVRADIVFLLTRSGPKLDRETLVDLIAEQLSGTYHCTRVWNAWNVGTMSQDDFEAVDESDTPGEIADSIIAKFEADPAQYVIPAEYPPLPRPAWNAKTIRATEEAFSADQMRAHYNLGRASQASAAPSIEVLCARIKAADDAAADKDYMLDSDDCIAVLRGTWSYPLAMDKPEAPTVAEPVEPVASIDDPRVQAAKPKHSPLPQTVGEKLATIFAAQQEASTQGLTDGQLDDESYRVNDEPGYSDAFRAGARFAERVHGLTAAAARALTGKADWWRGRADEIEAQVARSGSKEAMRCFTDMRTLLQAAAPAAEVVWTRAEQPAAWTPVMMAHPRVMASAAYASPFAAPAAGLPEDTFRGDTPSLVRNILALLELDAEGALVPHGVGGHARGLLSAAATRLAVAPQAHAAVEPVEIDYPHEQMDALAVARYKVIPSDQSMYWRYAVVAGEGLRHLYNGSEVDCQIMARKFAGAFLDGAFTFHQRYTAPRAQPSDALNAETIQKAKRYDWLRHGDNDEKVIMRGPVAHDFVYLPRNEKLDALIDAAMATQGAKP